jgi:hypothetical protein
MGVLSDDLKGMGYEPTEKESPFDENGRLWTKGYELVCDETGIVIDKDHGASGSSFRGERQSSEKTYRYRNSGKVKLIGGFLGNYEWGETEDGFVYDREH